VYRLWTTINHNKYDKISVLFWYKIALGRLGMCHLCPPLSAPTADTRRLREVSARMNIGLINPILFSAAADKLSIFAVINQLWLMLCRFQKLSVDCQEGLAIRGGEKLVLYGLREAKSVGFSWLDTWPQYASSSVVDISETRFTTYVFHREECSWIQPKVMIESDYR